MREIKLQFWDSESSEMIQLWTNSDFEVFFSKEWEMEIYAVFEWSDWGWEHHKREGAIRQFTWLLDKNGKEIYEGDIVNEFRVSRSFPEGRNIQHTIKWDEDMVLDDSYGMQAIWFCMYWGTLEVIWNIYENQELIK